MKLLKILLIGILTLIILTIAGLAIFIRTFDVNKFTPQITKQISQAIGREADIGDIKLDISWGSGVTLNVNNLALADDPQFSKDNFLSVRKIILGVDIQALFTKRQIRVSNILIDSPKILLIRDKRGQINAQSIASAQKNSNPGTQNAKASGTVEPQRQGSSNPLPFALLVHSIQIKDGVLTFIDKTFNPAINIKVSRIDLNINDFSLTEPSEFSLEASVFSSRKNIKVRGKLSIDLANDAAHHLRDVTIISDLSDISLSKLEESLAMIKDVFREGFAGDLESTVDEATISNKGLIALSMNGSLKKGKVGLKAIPLPLNDITVNFKATEKDIKIKDSSLELASGKVKADGVINDYQKTQAFQFATTLEGLDLSQLIPKENSPVEFQGKIFGQVNVDGKGFSPESILDSLAGSNDFTIKEGKLVNINVLKLVLSKISTIPGLAEDLDKNLPDKYKEKLNEKDTVFDKITLTTSIQKKNILLQKAEVDADAFRLTGQGEMSFNQDISLSAILHVVPELTKSMVVANKNLEYLVDEAGEIFIPVTISGKIPAVTVFPDLEYLGKKIFQNKGREELDKVLDKVFGKDEAPPASQPADGSASQPAPAQTPKEGKKSAEKELIKGVLDQIFH